MKTDHIYQGDCIEIMKGFSEESVDAVVTDPPYGLEFLGKEWDSFSDNEALQEWGKQWATEALRVLKPGGHLIAFGGTRTYHRMATGIEDAGFEVRDMLEWVYFSGFPKGLNIGKAVDKLQGNERKFVAEYQYPDGRKRINHEQKDGTSFKVGGKAGTPITKGNSEWEGFGTATKPAHEPIVLARKPLSEKTIVENVLKHGTGGLDIDGCRIPTSQKWEGRERPDAKDGVTWGVDLNKQSSSSHELGRFPANLLVTDDALNDGVMTKSTGGKGEKSLGALGDSVYGKYTKAHGANAGGLGDSGSKSRYFDIDVWAEKHGIIYQPKASKSERNEGCEGLEKKENSGSYKFREDGSLDGKPTQAKTNFHPTVKPVHLMAWLVRLVSKRGDVVLDPFIGSGTTGIACKKLGRHYIGIEMMPEYCEIAEARIKAAKLTLFSLRGKTQEKGDK